MTFEELGLAPSILRAVLSEGYTIPTPIQAAAIPHLLAGRDLLGCAQTGTGKTAAFALPILHRLAAAPRAERSAKRRIRALVLSPTRELALQIGESFHAYGRQTSLDYVTVFGGVSQSPQVRALKRGVDTLIATPGRLLDLMNQGFIRLDSVQTFVLDEADRMLDMGFLPDVRSIIKELPELRQTLLFSATMPAAIEKLANAITRDPVRVEIAPAAATTQLIDESVCFVNKPQKSQLLAQLLGDNAVTRALVFTRTKHNADRVARDLIKCKIHAEAMHGNKSQGARQRILASFRSNRPPVVVATDLAARGIDVDGVSHVFNYDLPHEPETYIHRIGRTGRAGAAGIAISFCDREERGRLADIQRLIRRKLVELPTDESFAPQRETAPAPRNNKPRREHASAGGPRTGGSRTGTPRKGEAGRRSRRSGGKRHFPGARKSA